MPWRERVTLVAVSPNPEPGLEDVEEDVVTTGGEIEDRSDNESVGGGTEELENSITLLISRSSMVEGALQGTRRRKPVSRLRLGTVPYAIRTVERVYPNKVRLRVEAA